MFYQSVCVRVCVFIICQAHFCFITWGLMYSDI